MLITGVVQSGPAAPAGCARATSCSKIAGTPVSNTPQLLNVVAALKPRETATIRVQRGDSAIDVNVLVAQRPRSRLVESR